MRWGHLTYDTWIWLEIISLSTTASILNECKKIYAKESLNVHNVKILSNFFSNVFSLFMPFYWDWKLALGILSDFPGIRSLSGLNDLNSLNDLCGLNDLNSLISSKNLLSMLIPLTWQKITNTGLSMWHGLSKTHYCMQFRHIFCLRLWRPWR